MLSLTAEQARARLEKNLERLLKDKGLTDKQISDTTGINLHTIQNILNNEAADISWFSFYKLAGALECLMHELIEGPPATLPEIRSQADLENAIWRRLDPKKYNVLIPRYVNFGPMVKMTIHIIALDPEMAIDKEGKETTRGKHFWTKKGGFTLTAPAIKLLSYSAGMVWDEGQTRIEEAHYENNILMRVRYRAVAHMMTATGSTYNGIGTSEWNRAIDDKDTTLRPDQRQMRIKFSIPLVESSAFARAFYDCLGLVEKSYAREDIQKPFVIASYSYDLDPADPEVKKLLIERALKANESLFGNGQAPQPAHSTSTNSESKAPEPKPAPKPPVEKPQDNSPKLQTYPRDVFISDWQDASDTERAKKILELADQVGDDKKDLATPDRLSKGQQMYHLIRLAEKAGIISKGGK